jgi:phage gpG-like protein
MAMKVQAKIVPAPGMMKKLKKLDPSRSVEIFKRAGSEIALKVQRNAQKVQILSGGGPVNAKRLTHRSGDLRDSIAIDSTGLPKRITVGTDIKYARRHELGINIKRRPFMAPALKAIKPQIGKIFVKHWKRVAGI